MIFFDTETCGFHGFAVLIQYAEDDGPVVLFDVWNNPIFKTVQLIDRIASQEVCGFNLTFDWFHLCKLYTVFTLCKDWSQLPKDCIEEIYQNEPLGRDGPCLKPKSACDLMLHARKGPYQSTMDRKDITIRRVPAPIAQSLADLLELKVKLKDIYFANYKEKRERRWSVEDIENDDGTWVKDFKNVVLRFRASGAMKVLAQDALNKDVTFFSDIEVPAKFYPDELGYAPFAKALSRDKNTWDKVILQHIDHWKYNEQARGYAENDVIITRELYEFFGRPESGDDDSILACQIAACRWKGYAVDIEKLKALRVKAVEKSQRAPKSPEAVKKFIMPFLSPEQAAVIQGSTKKTILEELANDKENCPQCTEGCDNCDFGFIPSLVAIKCKEVLDARSAEKDIDVIDKLLTAGRFHASFKPIGALSGRMSGADDLNAQGIKHSHDFRECFTLAWPGTKLSGGDFDAFEVVLAVTAYPDKKLIEKLQSGKKIHGLFGEMMFPEENYESIMASKGTDDDLYAPAKSGVFTMIYFGGPETLQRKQGIPLDVATKAFENWRNEYVEMTNEQMKIANQFQSMQQKGGIGSRITWEDPADYAETLFGFRRYFTLENMICKALFQIGEKPPQSWNNIKGQFWRKDRIQTPGGASRSAVYAAAFNIQAANVRAAINHRIQGSGAQVTKRVQRKIWDLQPHGANKWIVQPMNIHDEVLAPVAEAYVDKVKEIVEGVLDYYRTSIPLIKMEWQTNMASWAEK